MFRFGIKDEALKSAIVGCATVDLSVVGWGCEDIDWDTTSKECSDFQPLWYKCGIVDIAIAGYAVVGWTQCECSKTPWLTEHNTPYLTDYEDCADTTGYDGCP